MGRRPATTQLPGALAVGDLGGLVKLDPSVTGMQGQIIPNATARNSGVMTKEQAAKLAALTPGAGGLALTALQTAAFAATANTIVQCDPTTAPFTVTLPAAATAGAGAQVWVKNKSGASPNAVTVAAAGGDTVDGAPSSALAALESTQLVSDGVNTWMQF